MPTSEKILKQVGNEIIELTGEDKNNFIAELEILKSEAAARQAEVEAKAAARQSALAKLAELGLTEEEIAAL